MTDNDIQLICERIESLHKKILESSFAETVTESEMLCLILAVQELNNNKAVLNKLQSILDDKCDRCVATTTSRATKAFAVQLKLELHKREITGECLDVIDQLVKEMTEDTP